MRHHQILDSIRCGMRPAFPSAAPQRYVSLAQLCWADNPGVRPGMGTVITVLQELLVDASGEAAAAASVAAAAAGSSATE